MRHPDSLLDSVHQIVGDASFWISLAATRRSIDLVRAIGRPFAITQVAVSELERGRSKGRQAADDVLTLIAADLVEIVCCASEDDDLFLSLVAGSAAETLDDGEAATLVYAARVKALAVIDERKATILAAKTLPGLAVGSTVDLLLAPKVIDQIGLSDVADMIYAALADARMRVPDHHLTRVVELIGTERALRCTSLPAAIRIRAAGKITSAATIVA
jgi:predicted nucleic acid-binding protein